MSVVRTLPQQVNPNAPQGIHPKHVRQITGLAFMGVIAAWEEFLERTLIRYLAGAKTNTGYTATPKFGRANNLGHAYELLSQDPNYDPSKHYLKVSDARWVWRTADFFFSQHQYKLLQSKCDLLSNANLIRNRIAHDSDKCKAGFKSAAIWFLQPTNGNLTKGFSPGELLLSIATRNFGNPLNGAGVSHFEAYMRTYEDLAKGIVP
ncbi:hypothetical protein HF288_06180 [Acidithiobacillus caldus]|uniref:hypothetical protein n=1 Tax=Acidithiobacillus caldus TaxID=33059 RepID=UPI001C070AA2|nr:hypothetical protein [Acidithiobacillus caldus]MBU2801369.1 hypothetical protein [Acidithiobacillus caldus]MBU2820908.1 hypothetical protein [Acidithiobacillus caldus]